MDLPDIQVHLFLQNQWRELECWKIVFFSIVLSPWVIPLVVVGLFLGLFLPFAWVAKKVEQNAPSIGFLWGALVALVSFVSITVDILLALFYVLSLFDVAPFLRLLDFGQFQTRFWLTFIGFLPLFFLIRSLPSKDDNKKYSSMNACAWGFAFLLFLVVWKLGMLILHAYLLVRCLMGLCATVGERKIINNYRAWLSVIAFLEFVTTSFPLGCLTATEFTMSFLGGHFRWDIIHITQILKFVILLDCINEAGTLYFTILNIGNINGPDLPLAGDRSPLLTNSALHNKASHSEIPPVPTTSKSTPPPPQSPKPPTTTKKTTQNLIDEARSRGDKQEINRLRTQGDKSFVQWTKNKILNEPNHDERRKILQAQIQQYETIYNSRVKVAQSLGETGEAEHAISLYKETLPALQQLESDWIK